MSSELRNEMPMNQAAVKAERFRGCDLAGIKRQTDYHAIQSLPEIWPIAAKKFAGIEALRDPHAKPEVSLTYRDLWTQIQQFAAGLQALGIQPGEHIALFSDNSPRWLIADQGMMTAGAVNAVRGSQADREELLFILSHSDSVALVVEDLVTLKKLLPELNERSLRFVILLSDEQPEVEQPLKILNFSQLMTLGAGHTLSPVRRGEQDLATLMYTSGTSGQPKGVMLSHGNLLAQIFGASEVVQPRAGAKVLSILPIWHCYERTFEYFIFSWGCTQVYTNIRNVKRDLQTFKPNYMVAVPRLWESIYEGVQKQFREQPAGKQRLIKFFMDRSHHYIEARRTAEGINLDHLDTSPLDRLQAKLQAAILWPIHQLGDKLVYKQVRSAMGNNLEFVVSGGGSFAMHLEDFFEVVGVTILEGYGLTETAPITNVRRPWRNLRGAAGQSLPNTEICIVDPETRQPLPAGQKGLILIRGTQVMQGYYKNPEATTKAINPEGWFDSGDLGWLTDSGDLVITGRAKDTIVLTSGENIEPQPIEDACVRSPYIDQIMLVGQDQKALGALIVPNLEALQQWAAGQNLYLRLPNQPDSPPAGAQVIDLDSKPIQTLIRQELNREVQNRPGYRPDDRIGTFRLILEPFSIENGMMTQTLKIRRHVVTERYRGMIDGMFA